MYGWCGALKTVSAGAELHHAPEVEHHDPVGEVADDAEVVGDEEVRHALLGLEVDQQVEDRRLHGHVERGRRLVADDDARVARKRAPDRDALLEPARELHRANAQEPLVEADRRGDLAQALLAAFASHADELRQCAPDDAPNRRAAVERRVGVLEDRLERPHLLVGALDDPGRELLAGQLDGRARIGSRQAEEDPRQRRLAAPRLADEPQGLARADGEVDVDQRLHPVALVAVGLARMPQPDDRLAGRAAGRNRGRGRRAR